VKQIRKTLQEQEHLQERLRVQKEESDADNEWLRNEDDRSYIPGSGISKRHSWKEGVRCFITHNMIYTFFVY